MSHSEQGRGAGASSGQRLPWWLIVAELLALGGCAVWSVFVFSLLPCGIAMLVVAAATVTFPLARRRASAVAHFLGTLGAWVAATVVVFGLIERFGPQPFAWLLG